MPNLTTFGFEAEFQSGAADVIAGLHQRGLAGAGTLHPYHCDCDCCRVGNSGTLKAFRGQTDSSCSGEVISDIFGTSYSYSSPLDPNECMTALSQVAVDVDAEPGLNSGLHVHVGIEHLSLPQLIDAFYQYLRWEPVLQLVASGRWAAQRGGMNRSVRDMCDGYFEDCYGETLHTAALDRLRRQSVDDGYKLSLYNYHVQNDRHSNLNLRQRRAVTWEFRLWNSTRAAWRMEMFCGLSVALVDPDVTRRLGALNPPQRRRRANAGIDTLASALDSCGHSRAAELLERQGVYLAERASSAPATLTAV